MRGAASLVRSVAAAGIAVTILCGHAVAQGSVEYAVKGAFLYKFLPFVDWPTSAFPATESPFTLCIMGDDPFGPALDRALASQRVGNRAITLRRITSPEAAGYCQVVFIGTDDPGREGDALRALAGRPILTVTDLGAPQSGMIAFAIEDNHIRFDIDDEAAAHSGLGISSKLLSLARSVKPRGGAP